jgi:diacylglycerol kinase family enzyme
MARFGSLGRAELANLPLAATICLSPAVDIAKLTLSRAHLAGSPFIAVLFNTQAGLGPRRAAEPDEIAGLFHRAGVAASIDVVDDPRALSARARAKAEGGASIVVAAGGDGTVSAVVNGIAGTNAALGVIPCGTLNHFAKDMGIPLDPAAAVAAIAAGGFVCCDAAELNGRWFVNNSSLGLYPSLVRRRQKQQRHGRNKWIAMALAMMTVLRNYTLLKVWLEADGRRLVRRAPLVFVGNNSYVMTGFNMGARQGLSSGLLSLHVPHDLSAAELAGIGLRALVGRLSGVEKMDTLDCRELLVETRRRRIAVALDGEVGYLRPPLRYRSLPGALRVVAPAD